MSFQSPLGKALGSGAAKTGADHWLAQRMTAIGLVLLGLWFVVALVSLQVGDYQAVVDWVARPMNAVLLILLVFAVIYHSLLGIQVIIEDYVHGALGVATLIAVRFIHIALAVAGIYSVVSISLGAGQ